MQMRGGEEGGLRFRLLAVHTNMIPVQGCCLTFVGPEVPDWSSAWVLGPRKAGYCLPNPTRYVQVTPTRQLFLGALSKQAALATYHGFSEEADSKRCKV